jgi:hypothetical protein
MLGVALSVAAILLLTAAGGSRATIAAGVFAGLALLCKQTFFAALLAGAAWLYIERFRGRALTFSATALAVFAVPCMVLVVTTGGAFVQNVVAANLNPFFLIIATGLLSTFLETQWLPLVLAGVYLALAMPWRDRYPRLLLLYWLFSSLPLLAIGKIGANFNYWIELAAATAILAARGAASVVNAPRNILAPAGSAALILIFGMQAGGSEGLLESSRAMRLDMRRTLSWTADRDFDALVERARREPGLVLAEPMDVQVLAGRPVLLEPFIYNILMAAGVWGPEPLIAQICSGQIKLAVLGYSVEQGANMTDGLFALWPPPVMDALQAGLQLEGIEANRYVYTPRSPPGCEHH